MTVYQWFVFFLVLQVVHFIGTWKMYEASGRKRWEAAVPIYNAIVLMKIINRPTWYTILLFVPIVNLIMLQSFGLKPCVVLVKIPQRIHCRNRYIRIVCGLCKLYSAIKSYSRS